MTSFVVRCGQIDIPKALDELPVIHTSVIPTKEEIAAYFPALDQEKTARLIVLGTDRALAAVLTRLLKTQRLHVELAYVSLTATPATRVYGLSTGNKAAAFARNAAAVETPLIRDDTGQALVGSAFWSGPEGTLIEGECLVDDTQLFFGSQKQIEVQPMRDLPGVRGSVVKRWRRPWATGRAVQLGTKGAVLTRDGVLMDRLVTRSTFYRNTEPWLLVC
ncbi:MAG: hypothetical protein ACRCSF_05560 [Mycobacteriaceae bacterium]